MIKNSLKIILVILTKITTQSRSQIREPNPSPGHDNQPKPVAPKLNQTELEACFEHYISPSAYQIKLKIECTEANQTCKTKSGNLKYDIIKISVSSQCSKVIQEKGLNLNFEVNALFITNSEVIFNLINVKLIIRETTIRSQKIYIESADQLVVGTLINYNFLYINANGTAVFERADITTKTGACTGDDYKSIYNFSHLRSPPDPQDYLPYTIYDDYIRMTGRIFDTISQKKLFFLASKNLYLKNTTRIRGNILWFINLLNLTDRSFITSRLSGCLDSSKVSKIPGFFLSHSFDCGLNGGSYGGRGGIGITRSNLTAGNIHCIKSSISSMSTYGDAIKPWDFGSLGSPSSSFSETDIASSGTITILVNTLYLSDSSKLFSGFHHDIYNKKSIDSGGSVFIEGYKFYINGEITANGQNSIDAVNGAGGGGRIFINNLYWYEGNMSNSSSEMFVRQGQSERKGQIIGQTKDILFGKFSLVEAKPGLRPPLPEKFKDYEEIVRAQPGTVYRNPCQLGYQGFYCIKCQPGYFRDSFFEKECQRCPQSGYFDWSRETNWTCYSEYCDSTIVHFKKAVNPKCLKSIVLIERYINEHSNAIIIFIVLLLGIFILLIILENLKLKRTTGSMRASYRRQKLNKKKKELVYEELNESEDIITFILQGKNELENPWYLELDISKEFKHRFINKGDLIIISRELNRIAKWGNKNKIVHSIFRYFLPFLENAILKKIRKRCYNKIKRYLGSKNLKSQYRKFYSLDLWASEDYKVGMLMITNLRKTLSGSMADPFCLLFTGNGELHHPFKIRPNYTLIENHLIKINIRNKRIRKKILKRFLERIRYLNKFALQLNIHDREIIFIHKSQRFMEAVQKTNKFFNELLLKCSLGFLQQLKVKYQLKRLRHNKLIFLEKSSPENLSLLKTKMLNCHYSQKFTSQLSLFFTPFNMDENDQSLDMNAFAELSPMRKGGYNPFPITSEYKGKYSESFSADDHSLSAELRRSREYSFELEDFMDDKIRDSDFQLNYFENDQDALENQLHLKKLFVEKQRRMKKKRHKKRFDELRVDENFIEQSDEIKPFRKAGFKGKLRWISRKWAEFKARRFETPFTLKYNNFETCFLQLIIVMLFVIEFILLTIFIMMSIYHANQAVGALLRLNFFLPKLLLPVYCAIAKFTYIFNRSSKTLRVILDWNIQIIFTMVFTYSMILVFSLVGLGVNDRMLDYMVPILVGIKLAEINIILNLEGSLRTKKLAHTDYF